MPHQHSHGCGHEHDGDGHSHDVPMESGPSDNLYSQVDVEHVVALNAEGGGETGRKVIKPWSDRDDETKWCESEVDDSLIIQIPFISSVSLRSISIKAGPSGRTPAKVNIFKDSPGMDFSDADSSTPTQSLDVVESRDVVEYQVKAAKFAGITSLTLHFPENNSDGEEDTTRVYYIGLREKWTPLPNRPGVIIYESAARPTDHKMEHVTESMGSRPGY